MRLLALIIFTAVLLVSTTGHAELVSDSVQKEINFLRQNVLNFQDTVQDLTTTVNNQNEVIEKQAIRLSALEGGAAVGVISAEPTGAPIVCCFGGILILLSLVRSCSSGSTGKV